MAGPAHPEAMAPPTPGATRTAPPQMPTTWWTAPRIRNYLLFDATGVIYLLAGFVALRMFLALGRGPEAWDAAVASLSNPLYIGFHALSLASVIFVCVRFFSLFPKSQPRMIGSVKAPPAVVFLVGLYVGWIAVTVILGAIMAGGLF